MSLNDFATDAECKTQRYRKFLDRKGPGDLIINVGVDTGGTMYKEWLQRQILAGKTERAHIEIPDPMTEDFLARHAFDWGIQKVKEAQQILRFHIEELEDDYCPTICFHPGAGYQAAMHSGGDVLFFKGMSTSYTTGPVLTDWNKLDEVFNLDNRWIHYAKEFWRGVDSVDSSGIFVSPRFCRSPLDLANDLRGDLLFTDLYDFPDEVSVFLDKCADSIIAIDKILRADSPVLRNRPGGAIGVMAGPQTILMNGDPLDLISHEMVLRFNNPALEKVTQYAPSSYLHHHSIGIDRSLVVSEVQTLTVQQITQDPNGQRTADSISDDLIAASLRTPIHLQMGFDHIKGSYEEFVEKLLRGRFMLDIWFPSIDAARRQVRQTRKIVEAHGGRN